jgi:2-dehydropantoate 2-reductase
LGTPVKTCVVGAGAIGGWIAAEMAIAGSDISVIARGDTVRLIESECLRLTENGTTHCVAVATAQDPAALGVQELVVIAVKAPALAEIAPMLEPLIGPQTLILPMLNGVPWWFTDEPLWSVDPHCAIADAFPIGQIIGCVVHASCRRDAPNHVHVVQADKLIVGEPAGGASDRVEHLCAIFENTGVPCEQTSDVRREIWYKLWGNATLNPLSALTRATADLIHSDDEARAWMLEGMAELAAVGEAIGCGIGESAEDRLRVTERLGAFKTSMLQDVEAGRPIELEALLGAPREIARRMGVATPQLDRLYAMTRLMADNLGLL